jgi:hypothetical protein
MARIEHDDGFIGLDAERFEHVGEFLGGRLGPAFNRGAAARLPIDFHPTADDVSHRVAGDQPAHGSQARPRPFATLGTDCGRAKFSQSVGRHLETLADGFQF